MNNYEDFFFSFFTKERITNEFEKYILNSHSIGIDKLTPANFVKLYPDYASYLHEKIISGTYRFSPYLEKLVLKGRNKKPRMLSIPCIRDKIILSCLNRYLQSIYFLCVNRALPNMRIRKLNNRIQHINHGSIIKLDIKNFFGSLDHRILKEKLNLCSCYAKQLIISAITQITVPQNTPQSQYENFSQSLGIPQGLSISNILAEIYINDFDIKTLHSALYYDRYVDDIIAITDIPNTFTKDVESLLKDIKLSLNDEKQQIASLDSETTLSVTYLGYTIHNKKILPKKESFERYLRSLTKIFSLYSKNKQRAKRNNKEKILLDIFIDDLNTKIAGAIYHNKRYGWVFYFSALTDLQYLFKIDAYIEKNINKLGMKYPGKIKKCTTAFFKIKSGNERSYAKKFDIDDPNEMRKVLVSREIIRPGETLDEDEIISRYKSYVRLTLADLEKDMDHGYAY